MNTATLGFIKVSKSLKFYNPPTIGWKCYSYAFDAKLKMTGKLTGTQTYPSSIKAEINTNFFDATENHQIYHIRRLDTHLIINVILSPSPLMHVVAVLLLLSNSCVKQYVYYGHMTSPDTSTNSNGVDLILKQNICSHE